MTEASAGAKPAQELVWALRAVGLPETAAPTARRLRGAMSGAGVYEVPAPWGPTVLKLVTTSSASHQVAAARRELDCYLHVLPHVDIHIPQLLAHHDSRQGVALLLSAHPDERKGTPWRLQDWRRLAGDLARLHAASPASVDSSAYADVRRALRAPDLPVLERFWSAPGEPELLRRLLDDADALETAVGRAGTAVAHGDCHLGNMVRELGHLTWLDWQEVGLASPALDLAFCIARAVPDGQAPSLDPVLTAYAGAGAEVSVDVQSLRRSVVAAQLVILVVSWPHFAQYNGPAAIDRVHGHVRELAAAWWGWS